MFWNYLCQPAGWAAQADLSAGAVGRAGPGAFPPAALTLVWEARLLLSTSALTSDSWSCSQGMGSSNFHIYKLSMETFSPVVTKLHLLWSIELWLQRHFSIKTLRVWMVLLLPLCYFPQTHLFVQKNPSSVNVFIQHRFHQSWWEGWATYLHSMLLNFN